MSKKRGRITVEEAVKQARNDPALRAMWAEKARVREEAERAFRRAEAPVVRDLNIRGIRVDTVCDLVNTDDPYPAAIPVLADHLQRTYPDDVKEAMARALAVPEGKPAWKLLRDLFERQQGTKAIGLKWALACALAGAADDDVIQDVIEIVREKRHGENRAALLFALKKSRKPEARAELREMKNDSQIGTAARQVLRGPFGPQKS